MNSFLDHRDIVLREFYEKVFSIYNKQQVIQTALTVIKDVRGECKQTFENAERALNNIINKTETFNIMLTLYEIDEHLLNDPDIAKSMNDISYNQHRTIAINICDMYSSGATSFFGYIDCMFTKYFPKHTTKTFLAKGICALVASVAEVLVSGEIKEDYYEQNMKILNKRGITFPVLSQMVYELQSPYNSKLTKEECDKHVLGVLRKQQTYHTVQLCIMIDEGVEEKRFGSQFQAIVGNDEGLYGVDESLNTSVSKMYGMIAITNFGYLDKVKPGIIGELDSDHEGNHCNTFADDTVCALVAAACARLAYNSENTNSKPKK